jgi:O-antigen ligase
VANVMPRELAIPHQTAAAASDPTTARRSVPKPSGFLASTVDRVSTVASGRDLRTLFVFNAVEILADHPFLGVGPGQYGGAASDMFGTPIYRQYGTDNLFHGSQRTVDNFWLHLTVESGALGIAAFLAMIAFILLPICRAARRSTSWRRIVLVGIAAAAGALIVNSLTTMLLESNSVAFVFWLLLGVGSVVAASPERPGVGEAATSPSVP